MVRFINAVTGGEMWVHETRVDEYKAAGHRLVDVPVSNSDTPAPADNTPAPEDKPKTARKSSKKAADA